MRFKKLYDMIRLEELSGIQPINADEVINVSQDEIDLTEREIEKLPKWQKTIIEDKVHVMDFDNKFVLKPVKGDSEDKNPPKTNKLKAYKADGGDAKKINKKMKDNLREGKDYTYQKELDGTYTIWQISPDTSSKQDIVGHANTKEEAKEKIDELYSLNEMYGRENKHPFPYREDQVQRADDELKRRKSKLSLKKEPTTRKEMEDEEYRELMRDKRKRDARDPDKFIKRDLTLESKHSAEDATVYSGKTFDSQDEQEYYGKDIPRKTKMKKPTNLIKDINRRISEIEHSIKIYNDKGYNDGDGANNIKNKAIEALKQIKDNLKSGDYEGFRHAQLFFLTIMNPIQSLFPASLVKFLSHSVAGENETDKLTHKIKPHEDNVKN